MTEYDCAMCRERGKTWKGDDPSCAFRHGMPFSNDNWCCATMGELRAACEATTICSVTEDRVGVVAVPEDIADDFSYQPTHIVLHWYKSRGRTNGAVVFDSDGGTHALEWELAAMVARTLAEARHKTEEKT